MGLDDFIDEVNEVLQDLKSGKFIKKVFEEAAVSVVEDLDVIFTTCIDLYYADYTPLFYKRTKSLYDVYKINAIGTSIKWVVPYMYPSGHRVDGKYIYDKMFEEGWHGGAASGPPDFYMTPHPGYMAWRKPGPPGCANLKPYSLWGRQAIRSESPSDHIENEMNSYFEDGANLSGHMFNERIDDALEYIMLDYSLFN